jgi:glutamyl-tRNA(Gln) amidotransferase subunit D
VCRIVQGVLDRPDRSVLRLSDRLDAVFRLSREVGRQFRKQANGGDIVNITSFHDTWPRTGKIHYDTAKAGVWMLTKDFALELAEHGVAVNCIAPGVMATLMNEALQNDPEAMNGFKFSRAVPGGMNEGDRVRVERGGQTHEGVLLPSSTPEYLVVKLESGYNVGVDREEAAVEVLESDVYSIGNAQTEEAVSTIEFDDDLPTVSLISTGGTIASTVDYRTGAVTAQFDAEDVLRAVPELAGMANYRGRVVANILSENMEPSVWQDLAGAIHEEIEAGSDGIVVMHGTDTMQFTASAMAFMLDSPVPIVFTGSQRSADRPSSDNVMNAVCAVEAATGDCAEVLLCMHADESDDTCALHRGTRVRKNHTSRRDAFETVGRKPLGAVDYRAGGEGDHEVTFRRHYQQRGDADLDLAPALETDVELLKFTPGTDPGLLEEAGDSEGLILEGTGLGHVHTDWIPTIESLVDSGTAVVMTSQCLEGRICDRVYDTGRDLLDAGVVEGEDMLPGTAKVKLMWALANTESVAATVRRPLAGEITQRSTPGR